MVLKPQKYFSSFALRFQSFDRFLFRFSDMEEAQNPPEHLVSRINECMIYFLCKRPSFSLIPNSLVIEPDRVIFDISCSSRGMTNSFTVGIPKNLFAEDEVEFKVSKYPHKYIESYDKNGTHLASTLISNFIHLFHEVPDPFKDLEIVYIGKGLKANALDRLESHKTLQKILADISREEPENEIAILLYSFSEPNKTAATGDLGLGVEIQGVVAKAHFQNIFNYKPDLPAQIGIIEAVLINYFQTSKYNSHYIGDLRGTKVLQEITCLDFDAILVEINNENIGGLKIFSSATKPSFHHSAWVNFRKMEGRISHFP